MNCFTKHVYSIIQVGMEAETHIAKLKEGDSKPSSQKALVWSIRKLALYRFAQAVSGVQI
jgi:hypothetical protein